MTIRVTKAQQDRALKLVAAWLGKQGMTRDGSPVPTGPDAANRALGPQLIPDWDWPASGPTPTILMEGGFDDWAIRATELQPKFRELGLFVEPYASYALCLYRLEVA